MVAGIKTINKIIIFQGLPLIEITENNSQSQQSQNIPQAATSIDDLHLADTHIDNIPLPKYRDAKSIVKRRLPIGRKSVAAGSVSLLVISSGNGIINNKSSRGKINNRKRRQPPKRINMPPSVTTKDTLGTYKSAANSPIILSHSPPIIMSKPHQDGLPSRLTNLRPFLENNISAYHRNQAVRKNNRHYCIRTSNNLSKVGQ